MPSKWITRERPKIDRIACPWLIRRFIANDAEFIYVPTEQVFAVATGDRRDALRHTGRRTVLPSRRTMQLRRLPRPLQAHDPALDHSR